MKDKRFSIGRPNAAKRQLLAETLFPDMDAGMVQAVVKQAEGDLWLAGGAPKE